MKYGKIRIEDGCLIFTRHMMINSLPCRDIVWAYMRREGADGSDARQLLASSLIIVTRRKKHYQFDMSEKEVHDCIRLLRVLNPDMAVGYPRGGRIPLQSLPNTRDLGAVAAKDGRHIIPRKLLRSGELYHISASDKEILENEYKLRTVIDLRRDAQRKIKPDTIMAGVEYYHIPVPDEDSPIISPGKYLLETLYALPDNTEEFVKEQYRNLILDKYSVKQFARFFDVLFHQESGAVLWHSGTGKSTAGVGTALLLSVLGVEEDVIREDFMRTNRYLEPELKYMQRFLMNRPDTDEKMLDKLKVLYQVKEEYIDIIFETIKIEYGSMEKFCQDGLYLKPKMTEELKNKFLI